MQQTFEKVLELIAIVKVTGQGFRTAHTRRGFTSYLGLVDHMTCALLTSGRLARRPRSHISTNTIHAQVCILASSESVSAYQRTEISFPSITSLDYTVGKRHEWSTGPQTEIHIGYDLCRRCRGAGGATDHFSAACTVHKVTQVIVVT